MKISARNLWFISIIALLVLFAGPASAQFTNQQTIAVGTQPRGIAIDDLGNGHPDIVVANSASNSVSVLLGDGAGSFTRTDYAAGTGPTSLEIADVNGDNKKDIVVCDYQGGTVGVLLGNGNGTFQAVKTYPVGYSPQSLTVGTLDNTGTVYVVVTVLSNNTVKILKATPTGLVAVSSYPVGRLPWAVELADLNNDGYADIVTANTYGTNTSVLLGKGLGQFNPAVNYTFAGGGATSVAIADINGDGYPDLVFPNYFAAQIITFTNKGDGTFNSVVKGSALGNGYSIAAANLQGLSGHSDFIIADLNNNYIDVEYNNGSGGFNSAGHFATGTQPVYVETGDLKNRGKTDVVVSNLGSNTITIWYQQ